MAVLVHGRGHGPESMLPLADELALPGVHYVAPRAANHTWYPQRFTAPAAANEPWLTFALEALDAVMMDADRPPEQVTLIGFSQGACLTLEYVARNPRRYGAVAGLTGGLIGAEAELTRPAGSFDGTPLLITTAEGDAWVPAPRTRESAAILEAAGAVVDLRIAEPGPHAVRPDEIAAVRELLLKR